MSHGLQDDVDIVPFFFDKPKARCPRCFALCWNQLVIGLGARAHNRKNVSKYLQRAAYLCTGKACRNAVIKELHDLDKVKTVGIFEDE